MINDIEFILKPFYEGGAIISGQSKLYNISCHLRIDDEALRNLGVVYINFVCKKIEQDLNEYMKIYLAH